MRFDVLTLFPEMFAGYLGQSLLAKAIARDLIQVVVAGQDVVRFTQQVDGVPVIGGEVVVVGVGRRRGRRRRRLGARQLARPERHDHRRARLHHAVERLRHRVVEATAERKRDVGRLRPARR